MWFNLPIKALIPLMIYPLWSGILVSLCLDASKDKALTPSSVSQDSLYFY